MFLGGPSSDIMSTRPPWKFQIGSRLVLTVSSLTETFHVKLLIIWLTPSCADAITHRNHFLISSIGIKLRRIRSSLVLLGIIVTEPNYADATRHSIVSPYWITRFLENI